MPKRPRSHQLEDESWKQLNNCIPGHWVLRKLQPDYGIDGEIEIFDKAGLSTGLKFYVQLKGTDAIDQGTALSYYFPLETLNYYRSLQLPVLLVMYHSPSQSLHIKWAHEIDPYYTREGSKSIKVDFGEEAIWKEETPDLLVKNLKTYRHFTGPRISLPIEFRLDLPEKEVFSVPVAIVESLIKDITSSVSDIITFSTESSDTSRPIVKITEDLIRIDLAGIASLTLHNPKQLYSEEKGRTYLPYDILIGISIVLHRIGHDNIAADLAYEHILSSSLLRDYKVVFEIVSCFALGRRVDMALKVAEQILEIGMDKSLYMIFALPAFGKVEMSDTELKSFERILLKAIERAKESGFWEEAGSCHYNLGNRTRGGSWGRNREAFHHYRMASKYDPTYKKRDYFWSEVAGILFQLEKFTYSERLYNKAIKLGATSKYMALRADSLMFAGKYKEAHNLFKKYSKVTDKVDSEWVLKSWVLGGLIGILGLEGQTRYPSKATKLADVKSLCPEEAEKRLEQALTLDGLCGLAWFNTGISKSLVNDHSVALISFLMAALAQPADVEAWSNVVAIGMFKCPEYKILLPHVLSVAYRVNGENFIKRFAKIIEEQPEENLQKSFKAEIINCVSKFTHECGKNEKQLPIFRLVNADGSYRIIDPNVKNIEKDLR